MYYLFATIFIISSSVFSSDLSLEKKKLKFLSSLYLRYKEGLKDSALLLFSILRLLGFPLVFPFLLTS